MDNPLYRENQDSELEETNGNNTIESMTMFHRVFKKESFWTKYRSFLCAVGGLLVGCFITIGFCYLFFNLGKKQNDGNVQSSLGASKQEENRISRVTEDVNKTKEDLMVIHDMRKELISYLTDIKNTSLKELSTFIETRKHMSELHSKLRNKSHNETRIIQQWRNESQIQYQEFLRKSQKDLMSFQNMIYDILKVLAANDMCFRNETFNMTEPTQPTDISGTMRDCLAWKQNGSLTDGVYGISPDNTTILEVYCDMTTDGGGWIVSIP
ncbi:unnamed protein product [Mytilus coruscus]|uniref:Fibrinogen C-terminal domain-containing protein n=1 Tax=Mytilus coruscus TaxID=42192 RepID=A0A6J8BD73_MYTCO|nr:unnamed protein product [Mytilus coruscus]